jgi:cobyrinic acid a,c-diamide synthase
MAALRARGVRVAPAKVGPDFIDPGYHSVACGRPGRNLDSWICGEDSIMPLAARAAAGAELLVVEGVMGLFDGAADDGPDASTASIANLLEAPVILVVDASAMSRSVAAMVSGYARFDPATRIGGVILNRVGSPGHEELLRRALRETGVPVLGALMRDESFWWRDRHLGLVPVAEQRSAVEETLRRLAQRVAASVDLDAVTSLAGAAPRRKVPLPPMPDRVLDERCGTVRVAVAAGPAFSFVYQDNLEALEAAGAELVPFDPLSEPAIPEGSDALYAGGGFPEVYAAELSANSPLLADVRSRVAAGITTWAECGGLLWLTRSLDGSPLAGVLGTEATMTKRLSLGYRVATALDDNPLAARGCELRGHEFHYSALSVAGEALELRGRAGKFRAGFASPRLLASYLHVHLGGDPAPAARFVATAANPGRLAIRKSRRLHRREQGTDRP